MRTKVSSLLQVRASEVWITSIMFLYIFGVLTFYYILKPLRASLFLQNFPSEDLPYAYMLTALFAGTIATLIFRYGQRVSLIQLMTVTNLGIIGTLIYFRWAMAREISVLPYVYYVYVQIVSVLAATQFWLLAGRIYDPRQAKRIYGLLVAGGIAGAMAGSLVPGFLSDRLSTESMLLICIAICAGLILLGQVAWRNRMTTSARRGDDRERDVTRDRFAGLCRMVSGSRHLQLMVGLVLLTVVGSQLAEWQLNDSVQTAYDSLDKATQGQRINQFFGRFYLATNIVGITLQIAATGFVVRHLGILAAMLFLPFGLMLGAFGLLVAPGLSAATLTRGNDAAFRYSINRTGLELLYLPPSPTVRERLKVFVDVFIDRLGRAFAGIVVLVLTSAYFSVGLRGTAVAIIVVSGFGVATAIAVRRTYVNEFRRQLDKSEVDLSEIPNFVTDPASVQMLIHALGGGQERQTLYALKLLQSTRDVDFGEQLLPLFNHSSAYVRAEAARTLPALGSDFTQVAEGLLMDPSDNVRFAALDYILGREEGDLTAPLATMLGHEDQHIRHLSASWAAQNAPSDFEVSLDVVDGLLSESRIRARVAGAELATRLATEQATQVVAELLEDPEPEVAGMAARSAASLGNLALAEPVFAMLAKPAMRTHAKTALVLFGGRLIPTLSELLADGRTDLAVRREIPWILARIGGKNAAQPLLDNISTDDRTLRYRMVKALNRLHEHEPASVRSSRAVRDQLLIEIRNYYESLAIRQSLADKPKGLLARTIQERLDQDLEIIFRLIGLQYPQKDIYHAYTALRGTQSDRRAAALEFMDNVLRPDLKSVILPLLEEASTEHLIDRATTRFGIRVTSVEDSLRLLLERSDSWLKSCALYEIGTRGLGQLADACRRLAVDGDALVRETAQSALRQLGEDPSPVSTRA